MKSANNQLFYGDNLDILRKYIKNETIDLCYIDPPFNSKRNYNQIYNNIGREDKAQAQAFIDTWTWDTIADQGFAEITSNYNAAFTSQSIQLIVGLEKVLGKGSMLAYLVSMTLRIAEIHRALKPTGSFYFHCDPTASHYLKLLLDSIFCPKGGDYKNEIIWRRHYSHNDGNKFGCVHDVILFYTKTDEYIYNRQCVPYDEEYIKKNYASIDPKTGKRFRSVSVNAAGQGEPKYFGDKLLTPPSGTHWRWSQERINEAIKDDIIYFTSNGVPRYKQFLDNMEGVPVQDTWTDFYSLSSHDIALLTEIGLIQPGDFVNHQYLQQTTDSKRVLIAGNIIIIINIKANTPTVQMPVDVFSSSGNELLKLIKPMPPIEYLTYFANSIKNENVDVKYGYILAWEGNAVKHSQPLQEFK